MNPAAPESQSRLKRAPQATQPPTPKEMLLFGQTLELLGRLNPYFKHELTKFGAYTRRKALRAMPEDARAVYAALAEAHTLEGVSRGARVTKQRTAELLTEMVMSGLALRINLDRATEHEGEALPAGSSLFFKQADIPVRMRRPAKQPSAGVG